MSQEDQAAIGGVIMSVVGVVALLVWLFWEFMIKLLGGLLGLFLLIWIPLKIYRAKHPVVTKEERAEILCNRLHANTIALSTVCNGATSQKILVGLTSYFKDMREEEYKELYSINEKRELEIAFADASPETLREVFMEDSPLRFDSQLDDNGWFDVTLINVGPNPKAVINALKECDVEFEGNPWNLLRDLPWVIGWNCTKQDALKLKTAFDAVGAIVEIKTSDELLTNSLPNRDVMRFVEEFDKQVKEMTVLQACDIAKACTMTNQKLTLNELESLILDKLAAYRFLFDRDETLSEKLSRQIDRSPEVQQSLESERKQVELALLRLATVLKKCLDLRDEMKESMSVEEENDYVFEEKCGHAGLDQCTVTSLIERGRYLARQDARGGLSEYKDFL